MGKRKEKEVKTIKVEDKNKNTHLFMKISMLIRVYQLIFFCITYKKMYLKCLIQILLGKFNQQEESAKLIWALFLI
jgi:hypothetical protein